MSPSCGTLFQLADLLSPPSSSSRKYITECLKSHSYAIIAIDDNDQCRAFLHPDELKAIGRWKDLASDNFSLDDDAKSLCDYRSEKGVMVGFRREDTRQFFETRVQHDGSVVPEYLNDDKNTFFNIYSLYSKIAGFVINEAVSALGLDSRNFTDLTDISPDYINQLKQGCFDHAQTKLYPNILASSSTSTAEFSSSLLRICKYPPSRASEGAISFGAHTDTSFVTLGLSSDVSGLELLDKESQKWISVENNAACPTVVVFAGEFLQVLTKGAFEAAAHRVVALPSLERVSCPFIVRGRNKAVINITSKESTDDDDAAAFNGVTMKLLHNILDMKRKKCLDSNRENEGEWILSSYPMACPK